MFATFFQLGFHHLTEAGAWDHQLFLATIALAYQAGLWRRWVVLATVFAVGHSASLALATAGWVPLNLPWVEPGIALSIAIVAGLDLWRLQTDPYQLQAGWGRSLMVAVFAFGLVHGMGFSGTFVPVAASGLSGTQILGALASFTLGVEAGQLLLLAGMWLLSYALFDLWQWRPVLLRRCLLLLVALVGLGQFIRLLLGS